MLRNRKEEEATKLTGVNIAVDPSKLALGKFVSLQNWVPAKRYKIKKKRGVVTLVGHGGVPPPVVNFPTSCGVELPLISLECTEPCVFAQFAEVEYQGSTIPSGPAIRVDSSSTPSAFFGLAAIYVPLEDKIALVWWDGESLDDLATILDVQTITLNNGDIVRLEVDAADENTYNVLVNDNEIISEQNTSVPVDAECVGMIAPVEATLP